MNNDLKLNFINDLQLLVGKECWGVIEGTGSIIIFDFGKKIRRQNPIINDHLSDDSQNFESEFSLFIHCVWRVDSTEKVIFGSWTEHEIVHREINQIVGNTVEKVVLFEPAFDLQITFSNGLKLSIFCDQTNDSDKNDNYDFFTPKIIYTVGHKSNLETSEHDK